MTIKINLKTGDIFKSSCSALVNPVNFVDVIGSGSKWRHSCDDAK